MNYDFCFIYKFLKLITKTFAWYLDSKTKRKFMSTGMFLHCKKVLFEKSGNFKDLNKSALSLF